MSASNDKLLASALKYASQGVPVIPLHMPTKAGCSCGNPKCGSAGKHPRTPQGVKNATTDPKVIQSWWKQWPDANIGIATGDNLVVLDVDPRAGGAETLAALEAEHGPMPATAEVATGGGGRHLYFRAESSNGTLRGRNLGAGLELKAGGMLVVAPPSLHASGKRYGWATKAALAPAPGWLLTTQAATAPPPPTEPILEGTRNTTLWRQACRMRRFGFTQDAILAALQEENRRCSPPLPAADLASIAARAAAYEPAKEPEHLTDLGNARRFVAEHGEEARHCRHWGTWLVWDGRVWREAPEEASQRAKETALAIYQEASLTADPDRRKALASHAMRSESDARLTAMLHLAETEPGIPVKPDDLDKDPWALCVANGVVDLCTMQLRPHRREDLITKVIESPFDPQATAPTWERFLDEIFASNAETIAFLQRAGGSCLVGRNKDQVLYILWGSGANGKTTLLRTLSYVLGPYARWSPIETFLAKRSDSIPSDQVRLRNVRLVCATEGEANRALAESLVKAMTGGDMIVARRLYREWEEFEFSGKIWLGVNHRPTIKGTDHAIWRRVRLIPFTVAIKPEEQDPDLLEKLKAEAPGILAWLARGCAAWQRDGLGWAEAVKRATAEYKAEMDAVADFLGACCDVGPDLWASARELYESYVKWAEANGEKAESNRGFGLRLRERGFIRKRVGGVHTWLGLQVKPGTGGFGR